MCTIHQNTKLLVDAFSGNINGYMRRINRAAAGDADGEEVEKFEVTYRDLMKIIVCDIENLKCMVHRCENCPGSDALHTYLQKKFKEYDVDDDITFSQ